ncbi:hypothetical protein MKZ38_003839 [Zalerion maritima]|uniref:Uncharacterized protein n=1 Tax=Zalerion maritima TaxID=339359 RepID=A0AAD5RMD8_9PEZI|nr:hypothetical protein MKZ38_003839 [Zalerion maritima]
MPSIPRLPRSGSSFSERILQRVSTSLIDLLPRDTPADTSNPVVTSIFPSGPTSTSIVTTSSNSDTSSNSNTGNDEYTYTYGSSSSSSGFHLSKGVVAGIALATVAFTAAFVVLAFGCYQRWRERGISRREVDKEIRAAAALRSRREGSGRGPNGGGHDGPREASDGVPRFEWGGLVRSQDGGAQAQGQSLLVRSSSPNLTPQASPRLAPRGFEEEEGDDDNMPPPPDYQTAISVQQQEDERTALKLVGMGSRNLRPETPQPEVPGRVFRR